LNFGVYGFGSIGRLIARVALEHAWGLPGLGSRDCQGF
jgi:glyceraldehyde-3-phosphate dehydrogenase/erythrose-4-phosphate dehydrogenase